LIFCIQQFANAMTRRVYSVLPSQRAPAGVKEQGRLSRNKPLSGVSEPAAAGDGATGAPVTELEYKPCLAGGAVLDEINMATY
jgi:hypothetical protein